MPSSETGPINCFKIEIVPPYEIKISIHESPQCRGAKSWIGEFSEDKDAAAKILRQLARYVTADTERVLVGVIDHRQELKSLRSKPA